MSGHACATNTSCYDEKRAVPMDILDTSHPPVLLVDDDEDIRATLRVVLEDAVYAVLEAAAIGDALSALEAATASHVVLLDFLLPDANGDVLLQRVADEASLQRHRFVLMPANPPTRFSDDAQRLIAIWCSE